MPPVAAASPTPTVDPLPSISETTVAEDKVVGRKRFEALYSVVRDDLLAGFRKHNMPEEFIEYYRRSIDYNVSGGKLNRGLSVVDSVTILKGRELTESEYFKAALLGWSIEWLQAYILVCDDVMDASITRRGQPCWYRVEGVGRAKAMNDTLIIEGAITQIIRKYFHKEAFYVDLIHLILDVSYQTKVGQLVDLLTASEDKVDLSKFNLDRYKTIVNYKTAIYSFYLPVALALLLCSFPVEKKNESDPDYYKLAHDVLLPLGEYFQVQDDYLDFAGTPEQIGKIGTDIIDNKCSWCINTVLEHANTTQRAILDANYGRKDSEAEEKVKQVFREVGVDGYYEQYEVEAYARINALIDAVPEVKSPCGEAVLRRAVFRTFLEKIYKRTK